MCVPFNKIEVAILNTMACACVCVNEKSVHREEMRKVPLPYRGYEFRFRYGSYKERLKKIGFVGERDMCQ